MAELITGMRLDTGSAIGFEARPGNGILVAGVTGFGKSNEINYWLYQLAPNPHVAFILCSPAGKPDYVQWLPRASAIAIGKEATDVILEETLDLMNERYRGLVPPISNDITDEEAIRIATTTSRQVTIGPGMPMVFVVIDEFVEYLKGSGGAARVRRTHSLLTISRAAGMLNCLATQRPSDEQANTDIREQMPIRVCFATDSGGAVMVFGEAGRGLPVGKIKTRGQGYTIAEGARMPVPFIAPECKEEVAAQRAAETARFRHKLPVTRYLDDNQMPTDKGK